MNETATYDPPPPAAIDAMIAQARFNEAGLLPVIAQQHDTGEVLMMAWTDRAGLVETLETGRMVYFSRSRNAPWRKGETSGQVQRLVDLRLDCDGDTVLALVDQPGVACHTGRRSCFYVAIRDGAPAEITRPLRDPKALYG